MRMGDPPLPRDHIELRDRIIRENDKKINEYVNDLFPHLLSKYKVVFKPLMKTDDLNEVSLSFDDESFVITVFISETGEY